MIKMITTGLCLLLLGLVGRGVTATTISNMTTRTWNGKVDLTYTIAENGYNDYANSALAITLTENHMGRIYTPTDTGRHRITWDVAMDGLNLVSSNVKATVSLVQYGTSTVTNGPYCVVDLSNGPNAVRWPILYLSSVPTGGWTDIYKMTLLVLRRIPAGSFFMGGIPAESRRVTITKPFYIGVFEVTQKQWELVMGTDPSHFSWNAQKPVECVSYDDIRGSSLGGLWPTSVTVDTSSFLGRLRAKTGLDFDLPTEAQWEYAYDDPMIWEPSLDDIAWYHDNSDSQTHRVGMLFSNSRGLYDMLGNVCEWCRDWYTLELTYGTDPLGAALGAGRVIRGGSWGNYPSPSSRLYIAPSNRSNGVGFRLVRNL